MESQSNPFKGLWPYGPEDKGTLFGRDRDLVLVQDRIFSGRTTLLFAGSGVGKTSFIRAKIMPELDPDYLCIYANLWTGAKPVDVIRSGLADRFGRDQTQGLRLKNCFALGRPNRCIVILDQLEELFQYHAWEDYFDEFISQICEVINANDLQVRVVFSMREEFLGELSVFDNRIPDLFNNSSPLEVPGQASS